jgi:hypothetical protein
MISRFFKYFETLVDPYTAYPDTDTPPRRLFAFLWDYSQPFKKLFAATMVMSLVVAAIEIGLIWYMGRVVDLLSSGAPSEVLADHGWELILAALFVLTIRPLTQGLDVALLNNAILPQFGTLIRWRAHRQVLRQSVGFFENDFAGRIANRIMQTPLSGGEAVFQIFDAITFALAYLVGAAILLFGADPRLLLPLIAGSCCMDGCCAGRSCVSAPPRSQRGCAVGHDGADRRQLHQHPRGEALRASRSGDRVRQGGDREHAPDLRKGNAAFHDHGHRPDDPERVADRGRRRLGRVALGRGCRDGGHGRGGDGADAAAERHDRLDHVGGVEFLPLFRCCAEGMETITEPDHLTDAPGANAADFDRERSGSTASPTITGAGRAGLTG